MTQRAFSPRAFDDSNQKNGSGQNEEYVRGRSREPSAAPRCSLNRINREWCSSVLPGVKAAPLQHPQSAATDAIRTGHNTRHPARPKFEDEDENETPLRLSALHIGLSAK
jgi:hypothetical protein